MADHAPYADLEDVIDDTDKAKQAHYPFTRTDLHTDFKRVAYQVEEQMVRAS